MKRILACLLSALLLICATLGIHAQSGVTISPDVLFYVSYYDTYVNLNTEMTFDSIEVHQNYVVFNSYWVQPQSGNATIVNWFIENHTDVTLIGTTGEWGKVVFYIADFEEPSGVWIDEVEVEKTATLESFNAADYNCWYYFGPDRLVYAKGQFTSPLSIVVKWGVYKPPGGGPGPQPSPTPTPEEGGGPPAMPPIAPPEIPISKPESYIWLEERSVHTVPL